MDLWYPPTDRPQLLEWWRPLMIAAKAARAARFPWPIHLDEMVLVGRVDRSARPAIWVYRHGVSRGELYLDATGQAYKFTKTRKGPSLGRFSACDIEKALWMAGLPEVVEPIWFEQPPPRVEPWELTSEHLPDLAPTESPHPSPGREAAAESSPEPRRRGHLTVHEGGRARAG